MLPANWTQPGRTALSPRAARAGAYAYEPESDGIRRFLTGSTLLHLLVAGGIAAWGIWQATHRPNMWGGNNVTAGAIQATLVSQAPSIPLPTPQTPTQSVLATETPSPAPAPPAPAVKEAEPPPDAIPIPEKTQPKPKPKEKEKPKEKPAPPPPPKAKPVPETHTPTKPLAKVMPIPKPSNRVPYGEAAPANIPRSSPNAAPANTPVQAGGDFGQRFAWYLDIIKRKGQQNWYRAEVDPHTGSGTRVYLTFDLARDGSPSNIRIEKSSGSATLDTSALRAIQRVDSFGPLPPGYSQSRLNVEYYFEY